MKLVVVIPVAAVLHEVRGLHQDPLVDLLELVRWRRVFPRIEIVQVPEQVAERVAQLAVGIHKPCENRLRQAHVFAEFDRCRPQPQNLRPVVLNHLFRLDRVAQRFVHRAAFAIEHPSAQRRGPKRRPAFQPRPHQQRTLEPSAVLVAALDVHIGGPFQAEALVQHRQVARTGIEPHVQNVVFLVELLSAALAAPGARRQ